MEDIIQKIDEVIEKLNPHPLDKMVWVGKNFSKQDLCEALLEISNQLKRY